MIHDLVKMRNLIEIFNTRRSTKTGRRIKGIEDFITTFSEFKSTVGEQDSNAFNMFKILEISNDEVKHSSFLAWLLNTKSNHNQGNMFFREFIRSCNIDIPYNILSRYQVRTEFPGMDH